MDAARAVLRGVARLPRRLRARLGDDLRRGRERVARRRRLAQPRPGRDVAALERGPLLRRGRAARLEALRPRRHPRPPARGRRDGGPVREPRCRRELVAPDHARRPTGPRRLERSRQAAARPPGTARALAAPRRSRADVGGGAGLRRVRVGRRRRVLDPAQPRAALPDAAPGRCRGRLLRAQAGDVRRPHAALPAEPLRHLPERRRGTLVERDHGGAARRVRLRRGGAPARP